MTAPITYKIFKGTNGKFGAINLSLSSPHYYNGTQKSYIRPQQMDGWKIREGCVFLEMTGTKGNDVYDWDNKIVMALSVDDLGKLLNTLITGEECKLMHDPGMKSESAGDVRKFLNISSPQGVRVGCMFNISQTNGGEKKNYSVPVSGSEVLVLRSLLNSAICKCLSW